VFYDALKQLWEASFKGLIIEATVGHLNPQFITMIQLHRRKIKFFLKQAQKAVFQSWNSLKACLKMVAYGF